MAFAALDLLLPRSFYSLTASLVYSLKWSSSLDPHLLRVQHCTACSNITAA
jgi:hypothetical protein